MAIFNGYVKLPEGKLGIFGEKMGKTPGLTPPKSWELHPKKNLEFHGKTESFSHGTLLFYGVFNPSVP